LPGTNKLHRGREQPDAKQWPQLDERHGPEQSGHHPERGADSGPPSIAPASLLPRNHHRSQPRQPTARRQAWSRTAVDECVPGLQSRCLVSLDCVGFGVVPSRVWRSLVQSCSKAVGDRPGGPSRTPVRQAIKMTFVCRNRLHDSGPGSSARPNRMARPSDRPARRQHYRGRAIDAVRQVDRFQRSFSDAATRFGSAWCDVCRW
jgi:hypothetical protein